MIRQQRAAAALCADIAQRLADPDRVRERLPEPPDPAHAMTLSDGLPGIALLHLEAGDAEVAHRWLSEAVSGARNIPLDAPGLYRGVPALSFALTRAALIAGRPLKAADRLAGQVAEFARALAAWERSRRPQDGVCVTIGTYDVISGLTGLGAHLLDVPGAWDALAEVLATLTGLTEPLHLDGRTLPGWWTAQLRNGLAPATARTGHANVGLAHGVPGPLALLALAREAGVTVTGQDKAIHVMAQWLMTIGQFTEGDGPWWPRTMVLGHDGEVVPKDTTPGRPSWCYGTAGIARSLYLAGRALDVPEWRDTAVTALRAAVADARRSHETSAAGRLEDAGLCHGWGGLLQTTWRMATDTGDGALRAALPWLADRILELAAPADPFGLVPPARQGTITSDPAGFLTGAAGAALALRTFATDTAPVTGWDRALLVG
ncbi:lanthionine synthetase C family protein [Streptomyces sp. ET3-23]|uniref:lanthionine synthetase C family protein n=1 Tax=Streptomyces sp. ET3-23 TaxID=2885643 RepID=UPI001D129386|nr:lanthionine synthetase C family protein [Streptomyces sp. ET3-23]MCC2276584.1 lanthionine synthetase C family protein [Streptomyces sp. ET3-23]